MYLCLILPFLFQIGVLVAILLSLVSAVCVVFRETTCHFSSQVSRSKSISCGIDVDYSPVLEPNVVWHKAFDDSGKRVRFCFCCFILALVVGEEEGSL